MSPILSLLDRWRQAGWLRPLDVAFARFLDGLANRWADTVAVPAPLLVAAALVARLEGRGHACLRLGELLPGAGSTLGWEDSTLATIRQAWQEALATAPEWWRHPLLTGDGPLVFVADRLYLRRLWQCEQRIEQELCRRMTGCDGTEAPDHALVGDWLARLFPAGAGDAVAQDGDHRDWQREACQLALRSRLAVITGGPGTGKTYIAARLQVLLAALGESTGRAPKVLLAAPTGKAAARLHQSILAALDGLGQEFGDALPASLAAVPRAQTLHRLLGARPDTRTFARHAAHPLDCDVLFIDEASMVDLEMMAAVLSALPPTAKLVLLGDRDQLASVEAGSVLADLCAVPADSAPARHIVSLRRSHRFSGAIGQTALAINAGDVAGTLAALAAGSSSVRARLDSTPEEVIAAAVEGYRPYLSLLPVLGAMPREAADFPALVREWLRAFDGFRVLCAVREGSWGVAGLNGAVQAALAAERLIDPRNEWYPGRPVMVRRNDAALGVANGDIGLVLRSRDGTLRAWFDDGAALRSIGVARLPEVETAFALTVHKSQGSEFDQVALVLGAETHSGLTRELLYTGVTRARQGVTVFAGTPEVLHVAVQRRTLRAGGLFQSICPPG